MIDAAPLKPDVPADEAYQLGHAVTRATEHGGDAVARGRTLIQSLKRRGFGIVRL